MLLVVDRAPVVLEPVDKHLEWHVVDFVEVEALGPDLDEFFKNSLLRHIAEHDMLRVDRKDSKAIRNTTWLLLLLFFETGF